MPSFILAVHCLLSGVVLNQAPEGVGAGDTAASREEVFLQQGPPSSGNGDQSLRETVVDPFSTPSTVELQAGDASSEAEEQHAKVESGRTHGKLRGVIHEMGRKSVIAQAVVIDRDSGKTVETDESGEFSIWLLPGRHQLVLRADGFEEYQSNIDIKRGEEIEFSFRLRPSLDGPQYRTIVEDHQEVAVSKTTLTDQEIHAVPGTRGDPFGVVKSLPGVSQMAGFLPYVVVRGAAPGNTGYFLDGIRVPLLFHVAIGPSVIHPYFIKAIDFYPSGAPVRLGRFASGIVEGQTKSGVKDEVHGEVDLRVTDAGALLEIPFSRKISKDCVSRSRKDCPKGPPRGALTVAGRYSYTGLILSLIPKLNVRLQFWDFQARLEHKLGNRARYTLFAFGSYDAIGQKTDPTSGEASRNDGIEDDELASLPMREGNGGVRQRRAENKNPDPFLQFEFYRIDQRIDAKVGKNSRFRGRIALGLDRSGVTATKTKEWIIAPRLQLIVPIRPGLDFGIGIDQETQIFRVEKDAIVDETNVEDLALLLRNRVVFAIGLWADIRWKRGPFEIRPGLRGDFYVQIGPSPFLPEARSVAQASGIDPRILLRERVHPKVVLRQSLGMYHQPPTVPIPIPGIENIGLDRGLQRNAQGSFGYELDLRLFTVSQEAYLGRLSRLQDYELSLSDDDILNELEDVIARLDGWSFGLETMIKIAQNRRVFGWIAYTLSRSSRKYSGGRTAPSTWDQSHLLNAVLGYQIGHKWALSGRVHYNTGRPYTKLAVGETIAEAFNNHRNDARLPGFFQFDLRAERVFRFKQWELRAFLDVANSTFSREVFGCGLEQGSIGGPQQPSQTEAIGIPGCADPQALRYIVPAVGMRAVF